MPTKVVALWMVTKDITKTQSSRSNMPTALDALGWNGPIVHECRVGLHIGRKHVS